MRRVLCLVFFLILPLLSAAASAEDDNPYAVYTSTSPFPDVMDALRLAIEERGLFINNVMHMNEMLERTGADLGLGDPLFTDAESVEFCSAVLSRRMIAEDPARIVNCPFIISVYSLPDQPGKTFVAHRRLSPGELQSSEILREVADMLEGIAEQAIAW